MFWLVAGTSLTALVGVLDTITGVEMSFSLFYLIAIVCVAWEVSRAWGMVLAGLSATLWVMAEVMNHATYSHPAIFYWNAIVRLSFFMIVAMLLAKLRVVMHRERELALTDVLTGAANRRSFIEQLTAESERAARYNRLFSIAYLDLDHFKQVNDRLGHNVGDRVLQAVTTCMRQNLRKTDTVARLGGDEFALLLPETGPEEARLAVAKLRFMLLDAMRQEGWPITFSIGVLTIDGLDTDPKDLMRRVDDLMYEVKHGGRDAIRFGEAA